MMRRNRIGTKQENLWNWNVEPFNQKHGPLAIQEYIQELIRIDPQNSQKIIEPPQEVDINCWLYEHLRQFLIELNLLVTQLKNNCDCQKMKGKDEWLYLCAAHKNKQQECSALEYMIHNIDHATSILLNPKKFQSRLQISSANVQEFPQICRRLYRLFSHTYFHHQQIFIEFESQMKLCRRFTDYCTLFNMMDAQSLNIPKEAIYNNP